MNRVELQGFSLLASDVSDRELTLFFQQISRLTMCLHIYIYTICILLLIWFFPDILLFV